LGKYRYEWQNLDIGRRLVRVAREEPKPALGSLKKDELVALAEERGVDTSGTKAEIVDRLEAPGD
jgi:hypothetical protein